MLDANGLRTSKAWFSAIQKDSGLKLPGKREGNLGDLPLPGLLQGLVFCGAWLPVSTVALGGVSRKWFLSARASSFARSHGGSFGGQTAGQAACSPANSHSSLDSAKNSIVSNSDVSWRLDSMINDETSKVSLSGRKQTSPRKSEVKPDPHSKSRLRGFEMERIDGVEAEQVLSVLLSPCFALINNY